MEHSLETLPNCPSCNSNRLTFQFAAVDTTYSHDEFKIVSCDACGLYFTNPRPTLSSISKYYENPQYVSHTDTNAGLLFRLYQLVKDYTLSKKLRFINSLGTEHSILDYGAGTGDFASKMATASWTVSAFEPNAGARKRIAEKHGSIALVDSLSELQESHFGVITLWHVLEHVHELNTTIDQFFALLTPNGYLVIAVPNMSSFDASKYGPQWAAYDVPRHLYHFTPETLIPLITRHGFKHRGNYPMWFDSFYVSLLTEKELSKTTAQKILAWPKAFITGLISNLKAIGNANKCSSIIYVFQKAV